MAGKLASPVGEATSDGTAEEGNAGVGLSGGWEADVSADGLLTGALHAANSSATPTRARLGSLVHIGSQDDG